MPKRNWFKWLGNARYTYNENGETGNCIPYMFIEPGYNRIDIMTWIGGTDINLAEAFETEEELDSFIEALQKAKSVFHIKEMIGEIE